MQDQFLWVEKYRPKKIDECILPKQLKDTFQQIVESGELPNLMFTGTAGLGKTTVARALCEQLGIDYIIINDSDPLWEKIQVLKKSREPFYQTNRYIIFPCAKSAT